MKRPTVDDLAIGVRDARRRGQRLRALTECPAVVLTDVLRQRLPDVPDADVAAVLLHAHSYLTHVPNAIRTAARKQGSMLSDYLLGEYTAAVVGAAGERLHTNTQLRATSPSRPAPAAAPVGGGQAPTVEPESEPVADVDVVELLKIFTDFIEKWDRSHEVITVGLPHLPQLRITHLLRAVDALGRPKQQPTQLTGPLTAEYDDELDRLRDLLGRYESDLENAFRKGWTDCAVHARRETESLLEEMVRDFVQAGRARPQQTGLNTKAGA